MKTTSQTLLTLSILALTCTTGCRSMSWKMPGSSLLSWNRDPDTSKLASDSELPQMPISPAGKHEPTTIASVGANSNGTRPAATGLGIGGGSAYGYTSPTSSTPQTGLAAQSNGYQTGPYQLGNGRGSSPTTPTSTTPPATAMAGLPSPYGGTYSGTTAASGSTAPNITLPTSVANTLASGSAALPNNYPGSAIGSPAIPNAMGQARPSTSYAGTLPAATGAPAYPTSNPQSMPSYPSLPAPNTGATSAGNVLTASSPNPGAYPGASSGTTTAAGPGISPAGFAPGTTGRKTSYDFSGQTPGSSTLPPNTANSGSPLLR